MGATMQATPYSLSPIPKLSIAVQWPSWKQLVMIHLGVRGLQEYIEASKPDGFDDHKATEAYCLIYNSLDDNFRGFPAAVNTPWSLWRHLQRTFEDPFDPNWEVFNRFIDFKRSDYATPEETVSQLQLIVASCASYGWQIPNAAACLQLLNHVHDDDQEWARSKITDQKAGINYTFGFLCEQFKYRLRVPGGHKPVEPPGQTPTTATTTPNIPTILRRKRGSDESRGAPEKEG